MRMCRWVSAGVLLLATSAFSQEQDIKEVPGGVYLGAGCLSRESIQRSGDNRYCFMDNSTVRVWCDNAKVFDQIGIERPFEGTCRRMAQNRAPVMTQQPNTVSGNSSQD